MSKRSGLYPYVRVDAADVPAGGALLPRAARVGWLGAALSEALRVWRKPPLAGLVVFDWVDTAITHPAAV